MVSKLVQVVHDMEDKYSPIDAPKSIMYVPDDAPEWKKVRKIRGHIDFDSSLHRQHINPELVHECLKQDMTVKEIHDLHGYSIRGIYSLIRRDRLGVTRTPRTLKKYKYFDGKSSEPIVGTIKELSAKLKISETKLRNWATSRYQHRKGGEKPWVEKV